MQRALLIGNSRWHWAERHQTQWRFDHTPPDQQRLGSEPLVWAAVGPIPAQLVDGPGRPRIQLQNIPLAGCPPWLGVDRALGAWEAWRREQRSGSTADRGLLLADAGTVLSLTLLDSGGRFNHTTRGSRLRSTACLRKVVQSRLHQLLQSGLSSTTTRHSRLRSTARRSPRLRSTRRGGSGARARSHGDHRCVNRAELPVSCCYQFEPDSDTVDLYICL